MQKRNLFIVLQGHSATMTTEIVTETAMVGSEKWEITRGKVIVEEEQRIHNFCCK